MTQEQTLRRALQNLRTERKAAMKAAIRGKVTQAAPTLRSIRDGSGRIAAIRQLNEAMEMTAELLGRRTPGNNPWIIQRKRAEWVRWSQYSLGPWVQFERHVRNFEKGRFTGPFQDPDYRHRIALSNK